MRKTRLIVNADDCGWSRGITKGILLAHRYGTVTSTSLMVNQPATCHAVELLRGAPSLGVGIHLTLSDGAPVLSRDRVPTLVDENGNFFPWQRFVHLLWRLRVSPAEMEAEFRAQIRRVRELGITPTNADSHHHIHLHPLVARPFYHALRGEGIDRVRSPRHRFLPSNSFWNASYSGPWYSRAFLGVYTAFLQRFVGRRLRRPDCTVYSHPPTQQSLGILENDWVDSLRNLPPGTYELCCHPGFSEKGFSEHDGFSARREAELRVLTSTQFRQLIEENQIQLINYAAL